MGTFVATKTVVKPPDTLVKFEKRVKKALETEAVDSKALEKLLDELDKKEGVWSSSPDDAEKQMKFEKCCELRTRLEEECDQCGALGE